MTARKKASRKKTAARSRRKTSPRSPKVARSRAKPKPVKPDKGGRPAIEWTETAAQDVRNLAETGNTVADIAVILGVSKRSLETAIASHELVKPAYQIGCAERRRSLRTAQHKSAKRGNPTMLIWLGKQELGQRDYKRLEIAGPEGGPIPLDGELGFIVSQRLRDFVRNRKSPTSKAKKTPAAPPAEAL